MAFTNITVVMEGVEDGMMRFKSSSTGARAKKEIRDRFLLEGGGLEDNDSVTVEDEEELGDRQLRFVGGRATGDYLSLNHSCQFKYTHVPSHSFSITSALNLFLYISSHFSIALSALKSLYISHLISPTRLLLSVK